MYMGTASAINRLQPLNNENIRKIQIYKTNRDVKEIGEEL